MRKFWDGKGALIASFARKRQGLGVMIFAARQHCVTNYSPVSPR